MNLSRYIANEEKEWRQTNRERREKSYSPLRLAVLRGSLAPLQTSFALAGVFAFLSSIAVVPGIQEALDVISSGSARALPVEFATIWQIQATILAVIYPIVIAFVTILLRRLTVPNSFLEIYFVESGAMLSGFSAIALLTWMGLQYPFLGAVPATTQVVWLALDLEWLILNFLLTFHFLYRTLEFVRPARRREIVLRYAINDAWPEQAKRSLREVLWFLAPRREYFRNARAWEAGGDSAVAVLGAGSVGESDETVDVSFRHEKELVDVRFFWLQIAVDSWCARANRHGHSGQMRLPIVPGGNYKGNKGVSVCIVHRDIGLSWWEEFLIRRSFVFSKRSRDKALNVDEIIHTLLTEATSCVDVDDEKGFEETVGEAAALFIELVESSAFVNDDGHTDNYTQLRPVGGFMPLPYYKMWLHSFHGLVHRTVRAAPSSQTYFRTLLAALRRIPDRTQEMAPAELTAYVIEFYSVIYIAMARWWRTRAELAGDRGENYGVSVYLAGADRALYRELVVIYVGIFEELKNFYLDIPQDAVSRWEVAKIGKAYGAHGKTCARILVDALHSGDAETAWWFEDVVVKWYAGFDYKVSRRLSASLSATPIPPEVLEVSWKRVQEIAGVPDDEEYSEASHWYVVSEALKGIWLDVVLCTVYQTVTETLTDPTASKDRTLGMEVAYDLLSGRGAHAGQELRGSAGLPRRASDLYVLIVRQSYGAKWVTDDSTSRVDGLVASLWAAKPETTVTGRSYSRWGSDGFDSTVDGQLIALMWLSPKEWDGTQAIQSAFEGGLLADESIRQLWESDLNRMVERLGSERFEEFRGLYEAVGTDRGGDVDFDRDREHVRLGLNSVLQVVERMRKEELKGEPIDPDKLDEIRKSAASIAFGAEEGGFPIGLFEEVGKTGRAEIERALRVAYPKGRLTKREFEQRPVNEDEWFAEMLKQYVAGSVMAEVLKRAQANEENGDNPDRFWTAVKSYGNWAVGKRLSPILLVENATVPYWIFDWTQSVLFDGAPRPNDLRVWRDESLSAEHRAYLGNLGVVAVYEAPLPSGASILTCRELFKKLRFAGCSDGGELNLEMEDIPEEKENVTLRFSWGLSLELGEISTVRVEYGEEAYR